jgi:hypothetical protein
MEVVRRAGLLALVCVSLAGCASPPPPDASATTAVERRKVATATGVAGAVAEALTPQETAEGPCRHVFEAVVGGTHAWVDDSADLPIVALCTVIRCVRCGEVRHECQQRRRRAR